MIRNKKMLGAFDGIRWKSANIQPFPSLSHFYDVFLSLPFFTSVRNEEWNAYITSGIRVLRIFQAQLLMNSSYQKQKHKKKIVMSVPKLVCINFFIKRLPRCTSL